MAKGRDGREEEVAWLDNRGAGKEGRWVLLRGTPVRTDGETGHLGGRKWVAARG